MALSVAEFIDEQEAKAIAEEKPEAEPSSAPAPQAEGESELTPAEKRKLEREQQAAAREVCNPHCPACGIRVHAPQILHGGY
jgi:hypothetical protein